MTSPRRSTPAPVTTRRRNRRNTLAFAALASALSLATSARAQATAEPAPAKTPAAPPAPYSLPWGLRPVIAPTVVRLDNSIARYEDRAANGGLSTASLLTVSYRVPGTGPQGAGLAPLVRVALAADAPPSGTGGVALVNPLVGAAYAVKLDGGFRLNAFLGVTIPVGMGGGNTPAAGPLDARTKGPNTRAQLDNALFGVNDFTVIPGLGAAWVRDGWTVQVEATLLQLTRVRGEAVQKEASKTNMTTGLHVGYFVLPSMSLGAELRYQRWLNAPLAVERDPTGASRDAMTFAFGPRFHLEVGSVGWLRPGLSYQRAFDRPLAAAAPNYHIVQVDIPFVFK